MRYRHSNSCIPANKTTNNITMDRFFDDIFNGFLGKDMASLTHTPTPRINISEHKEAFQVELAVPGWEKSDFNINIEKNILTVEAKKESKENQKRTEQPKYIRREFHLQSLKRSFTLPEYVDTETIRAEYTNGILTISIPKKEEVGLTKKIEIA